MTSRAFECVSLVAFNHILDLLLIELILTGDWREDFDIIIDSAGRQYYRG